MMLENERRETEPELQNATFLSSQNPTSLNGLYTQYFAVLAGKVAVALEVCRSFLAYLRIAWEGIVDYLANACCDGEMVQFVALFLAATATLVDYPVRRFPRPVAFVGRVRSASCHQGDMALADSGVCGRSRPL
jgi:hypothetical protein